MHSIPSGKAFDNFLVSLKVKWWPNAGSPASSLPNLNATEKQTCQPFVTRIIGYLQSCQGNVHFPQYFNVINNVFQVTTEHLEFMSEIIDAHSQESFSGRLPDIVIYERDKRGPCSIISIGDVKGCNSRSREFSSSEIGHILDMATDLLNDHQFKRTVLYCFLTDGYRFQFFKCIRQESTKEIRYEKSSVYCELIGWQV